MAGRVRLTREETATLIQRPGPRGTQRQYVNPATGEVYSRRQAETAQVSYGLRPAPKQQTHGTGLYNALVTDRQQTLQAIGVSKTRREIRQDPATKQAVKDIHTKPTGAKGRKARALVYFGRRDPNATYDVGDTP
jgi:hypothetical protein